MSDETKPPSGTHSVPSVYWLLCILFVVAFTWRMQGVTQWPMPFHPMLQYENALNVKCMVIAMQGDSANEEEKRWMHGYTGRLKGFPIIEVLTAGTCYSLHLDWMWISGVYTSLAWMIAAWFLFHVVHRQLHSRFAAFAAVCFFVLHPFTFTISRSFQHEASQMLGFLIAWWMLSKDDFCSFSNKRLLKVIIIGLLLCCKPGIGWIPFCFIHLAYGVQRHGLINTLRSPMFYIVPIVALIPSLLWVKFLLPGNETHQWKWSLLLSSPWYDLTWQNFMTVIGWLPVTITLIVTNGNIFQRRWFNLILMLGYIAYAAVFSYANMTHDYYLLVLFPIIALNWGEFFHWFAPWYKLIFRDYQRNLIWQSKIAKLFERRYVIYAVVAVVTYSLTYLWNGYTILLTAGPYAPQQRTAQELGKQLGIGTQVIALTYDYAMPLRYFSGLHAQWWPTGGDLWYEGLEGGKIMSAEDRLNKLLTQSKAQYFVITLEQEYQQQKDLVELLKHYPELAVHPEGVRIFELKRR